MPLIILFLIFISNQVLAEESDLTLNDCYQSALKVSEQLKIKGNQARLADSQYREVLAAIYPQVNFSAVKRFRNSENFARTISDNNPGNDEFSSARKNPEEALFSIRQPIFTGFRELYLAEAFESENKAFLFEQKRFADLLFQQVAEVFYQINYYIEDRRLLDKTAKSLELRIKELREFLRLGRARDSEIEAAESDYARFKATQSQIDRLLFASREMLGFLINQPATGIKLASIDNKAEILDFEGLLTQAKNRSDVLASQARLTSADKKTVAAKREHWPTLSLDSNVYTYENPDSNRDWEILLRMNLPIFTGGAITARAKQAEIEKQNADLVLQEAIRSAERDIRINYSDYQALKKEEADLKKSLFASQKNYQAQVRDYKLGVVTNLEVLAAIRSQLEAERELLANQVDLLLKVVNLKVAAGVVL